MLVTANSNALFLMMFLQLLHRASENAFRCLMSIEQASRNEIPMPSTLPSHIIFHMCLIEIR